MKTVPMWLSYFHLLAYRVPSCIQKSVLGNFENPYVTLQQSEPKHVLEFTEVTPTKVQEIQLQLRKPGIIKLKWIHWLTCKIQGNSRQECGIRPRSTSSLLRLFMGHHHTTADPDTSSVSIGTSDSKADTSKPIPSISSTFRSRTKQVLHPINVLKPVLYKIEGISHSQHHCQATNLTHRIFTVSNKETKYFHLLNCEFTITRYSPN